MNFGNKYGLVYSSPSGGAKVEIGTDEVARGPLFGRTYAAAVALRPLAELDAASRAVLATVRDSKKVPRTKMAALAEAVGRSVRASSVRFVEAVDIDGSNIKEAILSAMRQAISEVRDVLHAEGVRAEDMRVIADGRDLEDPVAHVRATTGEEAPEKEADDAPAEKKRRTVAADAETPLRVESHDRADGTFVSVACAAILAKAAHDAYILDLCAAHPELRARYQLDKNMGYGTRAHLEGLKTHGATYWHRQSFRPVRLAVEAAAGSGAGDATAPLVAPAQRCFAVPGAAAVFGDAS